MAKVILISTASLFGLAIAAGGASTATDLANSLAQLSVALINALAAIAQMSVSLEHEIVTHAPPAVQALLGAWICARAALVFLGLFTLRMFRRFTRRMF